MAIEIIVGNTPYQYPEPGESPGWGQDATGAIVAIAAELQRIVNINDIVETSFSIPNNISSATDVTQLAFNTSTVRSVTIDYNIYRKTDSNEVSETGSMQLTYKDVANDWFIERESSGDNTGIEFSITAGGQLQYTSSNLSGTNYTATLKYRAKTLLK